MNNLLTQPTEFLTKLKAKLRIQYNRELSLLPKVDAEPFDWDSDKPPSSTRTATFEELSAVERELGRRTHRERMAEMEERVL